LIVTAPEDLCAQLRTLPLRTLLETCAALRPDRARLEDPTHATKHALRLLARRHHSLSLEIAELDDDLDTLVAAIHPQLLDVHGVGTDTAGQLLVTAGANHDRLRSEAAFAALCGVCPVPASSGRTHRHRLNRGGDRAANCALWRITLSRLRHDPRTRAYMTRRTTEGLSKTEIIRCLKRYIAREIYYVLTQPRLLDSP
jgi:transposase